MAKKTSLRPWLSAKGDCKEGRFIQVGNSLLLAGENDSNPLHKLTYSARWLYLCMSMESGGQREFPFSRGIAKTKYGLDKNSYYRGVDALKDAGFIELVQEGEMEQFAPSIFRFTPNNWKSHVPKMRQLLSSK